MYDLGLLHSYTEKNFSSLQMLTIIPRSALRLIPRTTVQVRYTSGIKLLNERAKAEEDFYFSKQDGKYNYIRSVNAFRKID
jgi:hypothetical protein